METKVPLTEVIDQSFTQYAGAVIQSRAIVDVRDCVKPSARQIYYSLYQDGFTSDKPFKKTLKAVGSAFKYYLHGDSSCEGIIMRSGQPFSMRYPLVEVEGSYGNQMESGNWAASRYTSSRLSDIANYLVQDTDEYSVEEWVDNYDDTSKYPRVMASLGYYNIVNGSFGIAVGISSSIPQFNIQEVSKALITLLKNPDAAFEDILCYPDFATGATIINRDEVKESLRRGQGKPCVIQAKMHYDKQDNSITVTELPFGVYTNTICEELEKLSLRQENFPIVRINDLTGKNVCIKIYISKSADPQNVIDFLYDNTSLQSTYGINLVMLEDGRFPKVFSWKEALLAHLEHERVTWKRYYDHQLSKRKERLHIVVGILAAIDNIDQVVSIIKSADSTSAATEELQEQIGLSDIQSKSILDMRLGKLTKLQKDSYLSEKKELESDISKIEHILTDEDALTQVMIDRIQEVSNKYADDRRTNIEQKETKKKEKTPQKTVEEIVIAFTQDGYIKSIPKSKFKTSSEHMREIPCTTEDMVQIYNSTKMYRIKAANIKQCLSSEKGTAVGALLKTGMIKVHGVYLCGEDKSLVAITDSGRIKRFNTSIFNGTTQCLRGMDYFPNNSVMLLQESEGCKYAIAKTKTHELAADISTVKESGKASTGRQLMKCDKNERLESVFCVISTDKPLSSLGTRGKKI